MLCWHRQQVFDIDNNYHIVPDKPPTGACSSSSKIEDWQLHGEGAWLVQLSCASVHPRCKVSCQGVLNWLALSLRPWFIKARLTVEKSCIVLQSRLTCSLVAKFLSVQLSLAFHAAGEECCERGHGQVCANLWCRMLWSLKCIRMIAATYELSGPTFDSLY